MTEYQNDQLITLLWESMKKDPEHKDRRQTGWGTKTKEGLCACIARICAGPAAPEAVNYGWDSEHTDYPVVDWQYEVANRDTTLGYNDWVQHQVDAG